MGVRLTAASELLSVAGWPPVILPTFDSRYAWFPARREPIRLPHSGGCDSAQPIRCSFSPPKNIYWPTQNSSYAQIVPQSIKVLEETLEPFTEDKNIRHAEVKKPFRANM